MFGEHQIFHYTDPATGRRLFSVAKLTKPGTFDLDHIETLQCPGLVFFTELAEATDPKRCLDHMLAVLMHLAEVLPGECREGYQTPWHADTENRLYAKVKALSKITVS